MKTRLTLILAGALCAATLAVPTLAADEKAPAAATAQPTPAATTQPAATASTTKKASASTKRAAAKERRAECEIQAAEKTGVERKKFLRACMSQAKGAKVAKEGSADMLKHQADCTKQAKAVDPKERRKFTTECVSKARATSQATDPKQAVPDGTPQAQPAAKEMAKFKDTPKPPEATQYPERWKENPRLRERGCNEEANTLKLTGNDRRAFMATCAK